MSSGNGAAFLVGFLFTPIITRLYEPSEYGVFAVFNAFVINISMLASLNYYKAIVLPTQKNKYLQLVKISMLLTIATVSVSLVFFIFINYFDINFLESSKLGIYQLLIPFFILITSVNHILHSINIRIKKFRRVSFAKFQSIFLSKITTVFYGYLIESRFFGLIIGELISLIVSLTLLFARNKYVWDSFILSRSQPIYSLRSISKEYISYPLNILPASWISLFTTQLPLYFLTARYDSASVGNFALANSLLNLPIMVFGQSSASVFLQKANELQHKRPELLREFSFRLFKRLLWMGIVVFTFISVFSDIIFVFFLGDQWLASGKFASMMGYYYMLNLLFLPLVPLFRVLRKENIQLLYSFGSFSIVLSVLFITTYAFDDVKEVIFYFSLTNIFIYSIGIIICFKLLGIKYIRMLKYFIITVTLIGFLSLLLYLIKGMF